jgi:hypothetical protein
MERSKKGQAALEFLLTYSWAILVVIVIIGALAYFGVLNPENFIPEMCTFAAGLSCTDYVYTGENLTIRLVNGLGRGIQIRDMTFESDSLDTTSGGGTCTAREVGAASDISPANSIDLQNGGSVDIVFNDCGVQGGLAKLRGEIEVTYRYAGGIETDRTIRGDVFVNVQ